MMGNMQSCDMFSVADYMDCSLIYPMENILANLLTIDNGFLTSALHLPFLGGAFFPG